MPTDFLVILAVTACTTALLMHRKRLVLTHHINKMAKKTKCASDTNNNNTTADTTMKRGGTSTAKKTMCADALTTDTMLDPEHVGTPPTETSNMVPEHKKSKNWMLSLLPPHLPLPNPQQIA